MSKPESVVVQCGGVNVRISNDEGRSFRVQTWRLDEPEPDWATWGDQPGVVSYSGSWPDKQEEPRTTLEVRRC